MRRRTGRTPPEVGSTVQPVLPFATGENLQWSVLWYIPDKDKIAANRCGNDFNEALRVYTLALRAGKNQATLYCGSAGFPPPPKFRKTVWRDIGDGTKRGEKWIRVLAVMEAANKKGIFWCPYCREFRRFGQQLRYFVEGRWARHPNKAGMLACPMCGISHRDFHVRKWNPHAAMFYNRETRRKRGSRKA